MTLRINTFIIATVCLCLFTPELLFALETVKTLPEYVPLVGVPGIETNKLSTSGYISALYTLSIGLAAALAVVKIIFAGVKYMLSEIVTDKSQAKKDIQGALLGLLIIIAAVTILNEINPNLKQMDFLTNAPPFKATTNSQSQNTQKMNYVTKSDAWKETDANILSTFKNTYCGNSSSCDILFVGKPDTGNNKITNQINTLCRSNGGRITSSNRFSTGGKPHSVCIKK